MAVRKHGQAGKVDVRIVVALIAVIGALGAAFFANYDRFVHKNPESAPVACADYVKDPSNFVFHTRLTDDPCNPASGLCALPDESVTLNIRGISPTPGREGSDDISGYLSTHHAVSGTMVGSSLRFTIDGATPVVATCYKDAIKGTQSTAPSAEYPHTWSVELTEVKGH